MRQSFQLLLTGESVRNNPIPKNSATEIVLLPSWRVPVTSTIALWVWFVCAAIATDFTGKIVSVTDGNTITVLRNGRGEKIRLNGIDCPEKAQAYGHKAKEAASALVFSKNVTIATHGLDKYGRTIGDVVLPDGTNVNHRLVQDGMCWWYRKYAPGDTTLAAFEAEARAVKRGLWADPNPIPPWEWRRTRSKERS